MDELLLRGALEAPLADLPVARTPVGDAPMRCQIGGLLRRAMGVEIGGRGADHIIDRRQLACGEARGWQVADLEGGVEPFRDKASDEIVEHDLEGNGGIGGAEFGKSRDHPHAPECRGQADAQLPAGRASGLGYILFRALQIGHDALAALIKLLPLGRRRHAARRAVEETDRQLLLETDDCRADRGRGHAHGARGGGK